VYFLLPKITQISFGWIRRSQASPPLAMLLNSNQVRTRLELRDTASGGLARLDKTILLAKKNFINFYGSLLSKQNIYIRKKSIR